MGKSRAKPPADTSAVVPAGYSTMPYPAPGVQVSRFGKMWGVQCAREPYSIMEAPNRIRFEVRKDDPGIPNDVESLRDRSELNGTSVPFGVLQVMSAYVVISQGADPENWNLLTQAHDRPATWDKTPPKRSPPFAFELTPQNRLKWLCRFDGSDGLPVERRFAEVPAIRGKPFRLVMANAWDFNGLGSNAAWLNGVKLYEVSGITNTYRSDRENYWKLGIYRKRQERGLSVEFIHTEFGGFPLLDRIVKPLPL